MTPSNAETQNSKQPTDYKVQRQAYDAARQEYRQQVIGARDAAFNSALGFALTLFGVALVAMLTIIVWIVLVAHPSGDNMLNSALTVGLFCVLVRVMMMAWHIAEQDQRRLAQAKRMQYTLPPHPDELPQSYLVRGGASPSLMSPEALLRPAFQARRTAEDERELLRVGIGREEA